MPAAFDPYHAWLGIAADEQPANHYRLLGINRFESDPDVIDHAADRQMAHLRTFQAGKRQQESQRLLNEVAAARVCLLNPAAKAAYDTQLRTVLERATPPPLPAPTGAGPAAAAPHSASPQPLGGPPPEGAWDNLLGDAASTVQIRKGASSQAAVAQRQKQRNLIALALVAAGLAVAGIWLFVIKPAAHGTLAFNWPAADRSDTALTIDDAPKTVLPSGDFKIDVPAGPHRIVIQRPAFKPFEALISVASGETQQLLPVWTPKAVLLINWPVQDRRDAELTIDGRPRTIIEQATWELPVEPGSHVVRVTRPGAEPFEATVAVALDERHAVDVHSLASSKLVIDWPLAERAGGQLKIDDQPRQLADSPQFEVTLPLGHHVVRINRPDFRAFQQAVDLGAHDRPVVRPTWTADDGKGLLAELYAGKNFEQRVKSRVDPQIDFFWGLNPPDPDVPQEKFSIRWTGFLKAPKPGKYKLVASADDEVRVKLDGAEVLRNKFVFDRTEATVDLTGEPQAIEVEYFQDLRTAAVSLRWLEPGHVTEEPIPAAAFFHDDVVARSTVVAEAPDPNTAGGGLRAQLFDDAYLSHLYKTRVDPQVDWIWGNVQPDETLSRVNFSIRWDGFLQAPQAGLYTLVVISDDGARLWLDDVLKVDDWSGHSPNRIDVPIDLDTQVHRIRLEYFQTISYAMCSLRWIKPGQTREEVIPPAVLRPLAPESAAARPAAKLAPPAAAEQQRIAAELAKIYPPTRAPEKAAAQAKAMFAVAATSAEKPAEQYMLLVKGAEQAVAAGDLPLAWQGIDRLSQLFTVDLLNIRQPILERFVDVVASQDQTEAAVVAAEQLADEAIAADRYDLAQSALRTASKASAKKPATAEFRKRTDEALAHRRNRIRALQPQLAIAQKAEQALAADPADAAANLTLGSWHCFYKADWDRGLPLLAKSNVEPLKSLARIELEQRGVGAEKQLELADGWWALSEHETGLSREGIRLHAGQLYEAALPDVTSTIKKLTVDKRLAEVAELRRRSDAISVPAAAAEEPFPVGGWGDILRRVDPARDDIGGQWSRRGAEILAVSPQSSRLRLPVAIDGSYDLAVEFTRTEGGGDVNTTFPLGRRQCTVLLSAHYGKTSGLSSVDGHGIFSEDNPIRREPAPLENSRRYRLLISVRLLGEQRASVDVSLDGNPYLPHWEGARTSLGTSPDWLMPDEQQPGLGVYGSRVTFHSVQLRMVSGHAAPAAEAVTLIRTPRLGALGNDRFEDLASAGALLVGFQVETGDGQTITNSMVIRRLQPVFRGPRGLSYGPFHGKLEGDPAKAIAKEGYAVGAMVGRGGAIIDGLKLIFMRIRGDRLDPSDTYESEWIGGHGGIAQPQLGGDGSPIIGIHGRSGDLLGSLGLIVERPPSTSAGDSKRRDQ